MYLSMVYTYLYYFFYSGDPRVRRGGRGGPGARDDADDGRGGGGALKAQLHVNRILCDIRFYQLSNVSL